MAKAPPKPKWAAGKGTKPVKPKPKAKPKPKPGSVFTKDGVTYVIALDGNPYPLPAAPSPEAPPPPGYGRNEDGSLIYLGGDQPWYMIGGKWSTDAGAPQSSSGIDWSQYFGAWGLPPEVIAEIDRIFRSTDDPELAAIRSLAYIRGTDWYRLTYPGIEEGMRKGVVQNEADYRSQLTRANFYSRQYLGRDITPDEFAAIMREGVTPDIYGKRLEGAAWTRAYGADVQYAAGNFAVSGEQALNPDEMKALGEQQVGLSSTQGTAVQRRVEQAQLRIRRIFEGVLASPALGLQGGRPASRGGVPPDVSI